jgi:peroxiredoxin
LVKKKAKEVVFGAEDGKFTIDGVSFNEETILPKFRLKLGDIEEWVLYNPSKMAHPFHIHVNAFQIVDAAGKLNEWADTVLVPPGGKVRIRTRYERFTGRFVLHCHILVHEDKGMMQMVCIDDPNANDPDCPPKSRVSASPAVGGPASAWRLRDAAGREVASPDYRGRRLLLVFHRGFECWHCAEQVALLDRAAADFRNLGVDVLVVSPGAGADASPSALKDGPGALRLLRDPTLDAFRSFGCFAGGQVLHGAFLIDGDGRVQWARVGDRPVTDIGLILENARKLAGSPRGPVGPVATK